MKGFAGILCLLLAVVTPVEAGTSEVELSTDRSRYLPKRAVAVTLTNPTEEAITFENPWRIERTSGEEVASFTWEQETQIDPGAHLTFRWGQWKAHCSSASDCAYEGYAGPGRYRATVESSAGTLVAPFEIGRYFMLGFRKRPKVEFTVFAARREAVRQMRAEADEEDPSLIVSGIVGAARRYNDEWSYSMRPGSIVLGEAFIEVCDAAPEYVEDNLDEWRGERWCPWSSFVRREGR
jgi:hypothetical protein